MTPHRRRSILALGASAVFLSSLLLAQGPTPASPPELGTPSALANDGIPDILAGAAIGSSQAKLFSGASGHGELATGTPFGAFTGGVRVAMGDVNGDGVADAVVAMGPGAHSVASGTPPVGGLVKIYDGADASLIGEGFPFGPASTGGIHVALGDVNGDGLADLIAAEGAGAHVRAYSLAGGGELLGQTTPLGAGFTGGVRVAVGDVNGDGLAEIIAAPASGPGPVSIYDGTLTALLAAFPPFEAGFAGGVFVASGDVNGDGLDDVVLSKGTAPGHILVRAGGTGAVLFNLPGLPVGGISVAAADLNGDGKAEIIGGGGTFPVVGIFDGATGGFLSSFAPPGFAGGVLVASRSSSGIRFTSAGDTTFITGTAGTFTITTSASPAVTTITQTGTLPPDITFTDNHDGTATLSGTVPAGSGGAFALTFTAENGVAPPAQQTFTLNVHGAPQITSADATTFNVGAAGSFTVTTIGFPTPALSATGGLPAGVTFTDNGDGTATLSGTPDTGTAGAHALTFTADNGVGIPATQAFTLTVDSAPVFTSADHASFLIGAAGSFTVTTTGDPAVTMITLSGTLPPGVTFTDHHDGTATIAGTPDPGTAGPHTVTLTASNGVGADAMQSFTLTVQQATAITSANNTTFVVGTAGSFSITSVGSPLPALSVTGVLPDGVAFTDNGNGTGTLAGTPEAGEGGTYALTIAASNGVAADATQSFTLTVNEAPTITSAASATFTVDTLGSFTVTTTGFPTPAAITRGGDALPTGVAFVDNGDGTALLDGTPAAGEGGTYSFTFTATNGVSPAAVQGFTLTVQEAPAFTSADTTTFAVGAAESFAIVATGSPEPTIAQSGPLPAGVAFNATTKTLEGTPTESGTFNAIQFTASNGVAPDAVQNFTLVVQCPTITVSGSLPNGLYNAIFGPVTFTQTGSSGTSFTWSAPGLPAGVSISSSTGVVSGTPTTTVLSAAVVVTVTDNFGCEGTLSTTITVRPNPDNEAFSGGVGNTQFVVGASGPSTPHVLVAGSVLDGDQGPGALTATLSSGPANGALSLAPNGTFTYLPNVGFGGPQDLFTYTLTDGNGITNTATVTIDLGGVVWYVDSSGGNGDGRSNSPFNTLTSAQSASGTGQTIFVHTGAVTTPGSITLKDAQTLWGQGTVFILNGLTIPAAGKPTLSGTLTLASNATVSSLDISTGASTGINDPAPAITGVTITNNVAVTTTTGTAVSLSDAGGSLTFQGISSNGAVNGISLQNTTGSFIVTGTGSALSGGIIRSSTGAGVLLSNVQNVGLQLLTVMEGAADGIDGTSVNGLSLSLTDVIDNGDAAGEDGISLVNASGVVTLANVVAEGNGSNNLHIANTAGTITALTIGGGSYSVNNAVTGNHGILIEMGGTSQLTFGTLSGATVRDNFSIGVQVVATDTATISSFTATDNTFEGTLTGATSGTQEIAIDCSKSQISTMTCQIVNNTMMSHNSHAINLATAAGVGTGGVFNARVTGNTIGNAGIVNSGSQIGNCLRVNLNGDSTSAVLVDNNVLRQCPNGRGIEMIGRNGTGVHNLTITNNNVDPQDTSGFPLSAVVVQSNCVGPCSTVRADVRGNTVPGGTASDLGVGFVHLQQSSGSPSPPGVSVLELVDTTGSATCAAQLQATNTGSTSTGGTCTLIPGPIVTPP